MTRVAGCAARAHTSLRLPPQSLQCVRDGRSVVLEGALLDPALFVGAFADAAAGGGAGSRPSSRRPTLVPLLVVPDPDHHEALVREACARDPVRERGEREEGVPERRRR